MLENLTQRLSRVVKTMRGEARLTETNTQDMLREVRLALLEADVSLPVVRDFIARVKEKALGEEVVGSLSPGQALVGVVHRELTSLMGGDLGPDASELSLAMQPPAIILMAGLQGAGKTTTTGKLARWLSEGNHVQNGRKTGKKKVAVVSADVYRPAAIEQLKTVAEQVGVEWIASDVTQKPEDIARQAVDYARRHHFDVLIVDTAGRLGIDEAMMREIRALHDFLKPVETLFVVDAMQGQDAVNTARAFGEALPLTGVVLTKLDGDARGGAALSVRHVTGKPLKFVGVSEKLDGLEPFHPERMAQRVLGMGDIVSLVEKAQEQFDEVEAKRLEKKIMKNKFDFEDFLSQIKQIRRMGDMKSLMNMIPGISKAIKDVDIDEKSLNRVEAIIFSMTPAERKNPELLNMSRKKRLAIGSGQDLNQINMFIKQFDQMRKMMHQMTKMPGFSGGKMPAAPKAGFRR